MTLDVPVNQGHVPPGSVACCLVGVTAVADGIAGHSLSNFGALPPEINSGRMYSGPGSGPLMAAAAAWDGLAAELSSAATGYGAAISELTNMRWWSGPASDSMVAAVLPFVGWLSTTATLAEQAAMQARAAAAAFEAAFAMTVPPPAIAANRTLLMTLVDTNWFGQNTPAIATTESQYAEMWAQDAAAMYGYASAAAPATVLTPFAPPPQTTNATGLVGHATAVAALRGAAQLGRGDSMERHTEILDDVPGRPRHCRRVHLRQRWVNAECSAVRRRDVVEHRIGRSRCGRGSGRRGWSRWMVGVVAAGSWTGGGERDSGRQDRTDVGAAGLVRTARHAPGANRRAIDSRYSQRRRGG